MNPNFARTSVSFVRGGAVVATTDVPGYLLEIDLPKSVQFKRLPGEYVQIVESSDPLLECCGRLALPWVNKSGPGVSFLDVPPPRPFTEADVSCMWSARNRISSERRSPTSGNAAWSRLRAKDAVRLNWEPLEFAVEAARGLASSWPTETAPTTVWLPTERAGGHLLVGETERGATKFAYPVDKMRAPSRTARRVTVSVDRRLRALALVSTLLADRLCTLPELADFPDLRASLVGLFRLIGSKSAPAGAVADPPPSTWPTHFTGAYVAIFRAIAELESVEPGTNHSPLAELWELYQAWVADAICEAIGHELVPVPSGAHSGSCIGQWLDGGGIVELHYQAFFPASGKPLSLLTDQFCAAIGALIPDLLLARREGDSTRLIALDAKKRCSVMLLEDLTVNASKYLWGIRRVGEPNKIPAIQGAVMISPLGGDRPSTSLGLAHAYRAHPAEGIQGSLAVALLDLLRGSTKAA